jgi:N-acetylglucosaminyl-diphospho-decaprenol L-rhamnosyltransferase
MDNVALAIVIVTFNTRDLVLQCLQTVTEDAERTTGTHRVIVVDNASTDSTARAVRAAFPAVELIENTTNVGIAPALNQGLQACADCAYVLLMNSDIKVLPGTLGPMLAYLESHPQVAGVSVQLVNPDMSRQKFRTSFGLVLLPERLDRIFRLRFFGNTFHMGRRAIYNEDQVGLFDEFYFFFNEDLDWSVRAHRNGLVFHYLPDLPVVHYSGQGRAQNRLKLLSEFYRMNLYFYAKFYGRVITQTVYLVQVAQILVQLARLRLVGKNQSGDAAAYRAALEKQQQFMRTLH